MYPGKLDDRGRVKVPAKFQQYLGDLPEKILYVTSLDRRIALIYPIAVWRENEKFFAEHRELTKISAKVMFNAAELGSEAEMDAQGRVTFSPEIRRELKLEGVNLHLYFSNNRIEVLSQEIYEERRKAAMELSEDDLATLEANGLN